MRLSSRLLFGSLPALVAVPALGQLSVLEEVVVTAQKREQNLQDVTAAVSVFSEDTLNNAGITSAASLDLVTPGLTMSESVFVPQPVIRGISTSNRNPGDEASVPTFVDGMYQPWQYAAFFEYSSIERIEVLRGPQGTLFGRNATGGAMNVVTRRPSQEATGELGISYNNFEQQKVNGYFSTGLSDTVAFDVAAYWLNGGGYYEDIVTGDSLGDHDNTYSVRSKLLWEPTDKTEITLSGTYTNFDNDLGFVGQPLNGNSITAAPAADAGALPTKPWDAAQNDSILRQKQNIAGLTIKHELDGFYIESLTGYQDTEVEGWADIDATIIPAARFEPGMVSESFTQALHFVSNASAPFEWIVGFFYMDDQSGYDPFVIQLGPTETDLITTVDTTAYAVFAEGVFDLGNDFSLTTGLRYSYEEKDFESNVNGVDVYQDSDDWSDVTPRVVLGWDVSETSNVYLSYSEAFKSGTYNSADAFSPAVNPENLKAWEAGWKWDVSDKLRINTAAFFYDHKDLQLTSRLEGEASTSLLLNAAAVESYGAEVELTYVPSQSLNIFAGYSYLDSTYEDFQNAVVSTPGPTGGNILDFGDVSGGTNIKSPEHSFFVGGTYRAQVFGGQASLGTNIAWTDTWHFEPDARVENPSHWNVSATAAWAPSGDAFEVSVFGTNLTNDEYYTSFVSNPATDNVRFAAPRTFGLRVTSSF